MIYPILDFTENRVEIRLSLTDVQTTKSTPQVREKLTYYLVKSPDPTPLHYFALTLMKFI